MTKDKKSATKSQVEKQRLDKKYREGLKELKRQGLYSGDLRKAPTDYGKRLVRKLGDVIAGKSDAVKVSGKGANKQAKEIAQQFPETMRAQKGHVIVTKARKSEKAFYSPKDKTIKIRHTDSSGRKTVYEYVRLNLALIGGPGELPPIGKNETYAIPRGNGVDMLFAGSSRDLWELINTYDAPSRPKGRRFRNIAGYVMIGHPQDKTPFYRTKAGKAGKAPENVIQFPKRGAA